LDISNRLSETFQGDEAILPGGLEQGLTQREIPTLNGLRAVAIFYVIFYHAGLPVPGGFGVLVFFTLSGFLITWLLLSEYQNFSYISLKNFYVRRTLRIFPAFYVYAAILVVILLILAKPINKSQLIAALLYVNNYYQAIHGDPNTGFSHTWSLAIEEQFYLIWAPSLIILLRHRKVFPVLITAILALGVYRQVLVHLNVHQGYIYEAFDTRADHLLIGCLLAWLLFTKKWVGFFRLICEPLMISFIVISLAFLNFAEVRYGSAFRNTIAFTLEPALIAMLIPGLINAKGSLPFRILESFPIAGIGRISYSMYLYQQIVIGPVDKVLHTAPLFVRLFGALIATITAGVCSFFLVEKPFLRLKARFQSARKMIDRQ
jgi:peptidoglycan/LPS O-acetylase OafA/YrhL